MIVTTLNRIRACGPCADGWSTLLAHLGKTQADDEPLPYSVIVESNGLDDALWCCRAEPQYAKEWRLYAVWCARQVQHLMTDPRSVAALDVAERYANGQATEEELRAAARDARDAWNAAEADARAAWAAAWDARAAAGAAAGAAAARAAWDAARDARAAAEAAAWAARAAWAAARDARAAAGDAAARAARAARAAVWAATDAALAARDAARDAQKTKFLEIVG